MPLKTRFFYLVIAWLPAGLVYIGASFVTGNIWIVPEFYVERLIPFSPSGIWLYLLFYVYIPYTFITASEAKIKISSASFIVCTCISGIIFVLLPSSIRFPGFEINGISSWCLGFVSEHDTRQNCFPSLHGSLITLCTITNWDKEKKARSYGCILLTMLMYYSILQVRRHVFIDLAGGIVLALLTWQVCRSILLKRREAAENF